MRISLLAILVFFLGQSRAQISKKFVFEMPNESITSLSFNPYEDLLAASTDENHIAVFNLKLQEKKVDVYGNGKILKVKFNPAGNLLTALDEYGNIRIWRTKDWELEAHLISEKKITDFDYHQQEYIIYASATDGSILQWAWRENTKKNIVVDDKALTAIHWVKDCQTIATANLVGDLFLYHNGKKTIEQFFYSDNFPVEYIFSSPQNNFIHFVSASGRTNIIVKSTLEYNFYMNLNYIAFCLAADEEADMFLISNNQQVIFYDILSKQQFFSFESQSQSISKLAFNSYLQMVAVAYTNGQIELYEYHFAKK